MFYIVWLPYETRWKTGRTSAKVISRNRVGIFPNERTRSTPLYPKLTFWCIFHTIWVHSEPFGCLTKLGAKRAELVQMFVPRIRVRVFRNERTRSTPLDPKLTFWCVHTIWVHSGQFGSLTKLGVKQAELVQKFVPRGCVRIFHNEHTRSTPFVPKLTFWCISYHFGASRTVWLPYETRYKTGRTMLKFLQQSRFGMF